ncbi:hypothetical protein HPP92_016148 [Vanilla planifolia]|uniref:Uncharacterized protein n=1 Tax=Vanilla planifolia TaxID=51239 RepID=A0A835QMJ5_VANPL|nr:hypothetical protein HPP92_016148 [Vanilla planifolia]
MDIESDVEENISIEAEGEIFVVAKQLWEDRSAREFLLVLCRKAGNEQMLKIEAKIKISIEYPLRAPLFNLRLLLDDSRSSYECYNELRAMESEINLHIFKIISMDNEDFILAHQIRCLAMLFDLHFDTRFGKRNSSVIDAGLGKVVNDSLLARVRRGRDRRSLLSWKGGSGFMAALND